MPHAVNSRLKGPFRLRTLLPKETGHTWCVPASCRLFAHRSANVFEKEKSRLPGFETEKISRTLVGDINGDGLNDIITVGFETTINVYLNDMSDENVAFIGRAAC